ncbi:hypothetical protein ACHAWU_008940 [Discostella pseudostelligera]|uniref:Uncharacterized protein n=1 Tax=Discostella pseudostelligera TaxID=259834 RepID=A0ABD3MBA0_9STRA
MSPIAIQTPLNPEVLPYLETLSPPPTPIAKRGRSFFPAGDDASLNVPMFFPKSASIFGSYQPQSPRSTQPANKDDNSVEAELMFIISYPSPRFRLEQRRTITISPPPLTPPQNEKFVLQVPDNSLPLLIPKLPLLPERSKSDNVSFTLMKRSHPALIQSMPQRPTLDMNHRKVERRHSYVAKSA